MARPPAARISLAVSSTIARSPRPLTTIAAPSAARRKAIAFPIFLPEPVMIATLPASACASAISASLPMPGEVSTPRRNRSIARRRLAAHRFEAERDGAIGRDAIGDDVGQHQLQPVDRPGAEQRVALVDQVKGRADDDGRHQRAARHAGGNDALPDRLPPHDAYSPPVVSPIPTPKSGIAAASKLAFCRSHVTRCRVSPRPQPAGLEP